MDVCFSPFTNIYKSLASPKGLQNIDPSFSVLISTLNNADIIYVHDKQQFFLSGMVWLYVLTVWSCASCTPIDSIPGADGCPTASKEAYRGSIFNDHI